MCQHHDLSITQIEYKALFIKVCSIQNLNWLLLKTLNYESLQRCVTWLLHILYFETKPTVIHLNCIYCSVQQLLIFRLKVYLWRPVKTQSYNSLNMICNIRPSSLLWNGNALLNFRKLIAWIIIWSA